MFDQADLPERVARRDTGAFDQMYCECAPRLLIYLRHLIGDRQAAEDVMQNTFTELWRRPGSFDPKRGSLRAWLFGAARRQAAEWWRRHRAADPLEAEPSCDSLESSSLMNDSLRHLPEGQRSLLWLREVEGHSYAELAVILDIPIGTVRSRLFTAREALRELWVEPLARKGGRV